MFLSSTTASSSLPLPYTASFDLVKIVWMNKWRITPFSREIHIKIIRHLTFEIVLYNWHNNFYAPLTLVKLTSGKENKETDTTAIMFWLPK